MQPSLHRDNKKLPRARLMYIIYVAIFGVIWGIGTSILATTLPPDPITRVIFVAWFETIILFLTKLVVRRPLSVTFAITIAATISIFTFSFGPPNPYKPLFAFSGLAFDIGTLFRMKTLRYWNLLVGFILYLLVLFPTFLFIIWLMDPAAAKVVWLATPVAAGIYLIEGIITSLVLWHFLQPTKAPDRVREIWRHVGAE